MKHNFSQQIRSFNRFYTVIMGILNKCFIESKYSLPETRLLHAVYTNPEITPTELTILLNIDKSYLSRMNIKLEKGKLLFKKERHMTNDQ